ncbi:hypothetical protein [Streptosporangium roseum]|uniref:Uncharacterized protein n=1 Tax=Streptosporangium roseum (strain ATCC 12428 / DSM 43021 / JCM 3005 / KCTC 9067 / NCIMB 10171 / NRRL 2505 / NI 9100) TaxID=479432 RepID=D2B562_STRRD|nr:hypothetical protein [Streptosporangium roseum]ACZ87586.1 hypothetical protein Sros_4748 [Streptosporangium roseum DSM 43021]
MERRTRGAAGGAGETHRTPLYVAVTKYLAGSFNFGGAMKDCRACPADVRARPARSPGAWRDRDQFE